MNITIREKDKAFQAIVSYKKNGIWKQKSKQGFSTKKDAKAWANEMQFKLTEDRKDNIDTSDMTVGQALEIYLDYKKNTVKFSSFKIIKNSLIHLTPLSNCKISKITPIQITTLVQEKRKSGMLGNRLQYDFITFFNFCIKELKAIRENPVNFIKYKNEKKKEKYIDNDLYLKILNNLPNEKLILMVKILYNTGLRMGELLGLKQSDIKDGIITVSRQNYKGVITGLKTENSYRKIPIPKLLCHEIKNYKLQSIDGFLFTSRSSLEFHLRKYNLSPHCFRHTFATNMVANGYNLKIASEILGDTFEMFVRVYVQTSQTEKDRLFKEIIGS